MTRIHQRIRRCIQAELNCLCVPRTSSPSLSSTFPARNLDITVPDGSQVGIVPGLSSEEFAQFAQDAKAACLITRALVGVENVILTARLED